MSGAGSDNPAAPQSGWWLASDGRWYPPSTPPGEQDATATLPISAQLTTEPSPGLHQIWSNPAAPNPVAGPGPTSSWSVENRLARMKGTGFSSGDTRAHRRVPLLAVILVLVLLGAGAFVVVHTLGGNTGSGPPAPTAAPSILGKTAYGPAGVRFVAAFPSPPKSSANSASLLQNFPSGSHAFGYWVSPDTGDIFASTAPVPHPPTFAVIAATLPSPSMATEFLSGGQKVGTFQRVTVDGLAGLEYVGPENSPINQGNTLTDPNATQGEMVVVKGSTAYIVFAVTSDPSTARQFLASFHVTS
jgi:hypothetical protein